jgi:cytochrome c
MIASISAFAPEVTPPADRGRNQAIVLPLPRHWAGTFEGFNYSPANKSSGITWREETFPKYIRAPMQEMRGTRMAFVGIKNERTSQTSGPISSSWGLMGRRNETRRAGKREEKQESR